MSLFTQPPRLLSNKENTLFAPSARILPPPLPLTHPHPHLSYHRHLPIPALSSLHIDGKPRIAGIGPSPRRRNGTGIHGVKPYSRNREVSSSTAIQRAKAKAAEAKVKANGKKRPAELRLASSSKASANPPATSQIIQSADASSAIATSTATSANRSGPTPRMARIPLRLPKPIIPPVSQLDDETLANIPIEYILPRLLPRLPSLGIVSALYRPYSGYNLPASSSTSGSLAFGVPAIVEGKDQDGSIAKRVAGREPDLCLAVGKRGDALTGRRLVPVNKLVFTTQCSFWHRVISSFGTEVSSVPSSPISTTNSNSDPASPTIGTSTRSTSGPAATFATLNLAPVSGPVSQTQSTALETIAEDTEVLDAGDEVTPDSLQQASSASPGQASPATEISEDEGDNADHNLDNSLDSDCTLHPDSNTPTYPPSILHLPVVHLDLPCPEVYPTLHNLLHFASARTHSAAKDVAATASSDSIANPASTPPPVSSAPKADQTRSISILTSLLALPPSLHTQSEIDAALATLPLPELMGKLERMHAVWKDVCYLGIRSGEVWRVMGEGWGGVVGVVAGRAAGVSVNASKDGVAKGMKKEAGGGEGGAAGEMMDESA